MKISEKKLYKVSRECKGYDEYDSAVICAKTEVEAIADQTAKWEKVRYIGKADKSIELGVVVSSFNAG